MNLSQETGHLRIIAALNHGID